MKVIIKDSGEVKTVSLGYAVNYLLPKGLAVKATGIRIAAMKKEKEAAVSEKLQAKDNDRQQAERLDGKVITFKKTAGKAGKIHGGVTKKEIAAKLKILKTNIILAEPIKKLGEYPVELKFSTQIAKIKVKVVNNEKSES